MADGAKLYDLIHGLTVEQLGGVGAPEQVVRDRIASIVRQHTFQVYDSIAIYYLELLPPIRTVARACGYAVGLHGSMSRDFDLIACPWSHEAKSAEELAEAVRESCGGPFEGNITEKPHGRRAWTIRISGHAYVDLSVMPRYEIHVGSTC